MTPSATEAAAGGPEPGRPRPSRLRPLAAGVAVLVALAVGLLQLVGGGETAGPAEPPAEPPPPGFLDGAAGFAVRVDSLAIPYDPFAVFALPGDTLAVEALYVGGEAEAGADAGVLERTGPRAWRWTAPADPGLSRLRVTSAEGETITLNAFTLVPFDHRTDAIDHYAIGDYQDEPLDGDPAYAEPPGFVRVTPELAGVAVSPHFTLGEFLAKQPSAWPKYLLLDPELVLKLERLLSAVNAAGVEAPSLTVMSGYRTPAYNASIGNETVYSRHLYGDAADVFVDVDGDGRMDDVDGDGEETQADADWLAALAEGVERLPWAAPLVGGIGIYGPAPHRGPFVHVDTRGEPVRW